MTDFYLTAGSGISIVENVSASTITVNSTFENKRSVVIPLNTSASLVGTEVNYVRIPANMAGWYLQDLEVSCSASSTSGSPAFLVSRASASSISFVDMLTTNLTIDQGEYDSTNALIPPVISTSGSRVLAGDKIKVNSASASACGTGVTYAQVSLTFSG